MFRTKLYRSLISALHVCRGRLLARLEEGRHLPLTVCDVATRCPTINDAKQANRSSRMDTLKDPDGSVTLYIGPDKPKGGKAKNWIQTVLGMGWLPYFHICSLKKAFLDTTWIFPDIERGPGNL